MPAAEKTCQSYAEGGQPCILPEGHNMGHPDLPENHRAADKKRVRVVTLNSRSGDGTARAKYTIEIVRERDTWTSQSNADLPQASDLPPDIREALEVWLALG